MKEKLIAATADSEWRTALLEVIGVNNVHLVPLGEPEMRRSGVLEMLSASPAYLDYVKGKEMAPPGYCTLQKHFKRMVAVRRKVDRANRAESGVVADGWHEKYGTLEVLLDEFIAQIDAKKVEEKKEKAKKVAPEKGYVDQRRAVCDAALGKRASGGDGDSDGDVSPVAASRKRMKGNSSDVIDLTGEQELAIMKDNVNKRRESNNRQLEMEECRLNLERESFEAYRKTRSAG